MAGNKDFGRFAALGGVTNRELRGHDYLRGIASKGGKASASKGREHMARIGAMGLAARRAKERDAVLEEAAAALHAVYVKHICSRASGGDMCAVALECADALRAMKSGGRNG